MKVDGEISLTGLPPRRGMILSVCFYRVRGPEAPPPYNGDPPAEAAADLHQVLEDVHLDRDCEEATFSTTFSLQHAPGHYYGQVRVILFRAQGGKLIAQTEQFFFGRRTLRLEAGTGPVRFPIVWPSTPLDELHRYGTIEPQG